MSTEREIDRCQSEQRHERLLWMYGPPRERAGHLAQVDAWVAEECAIRREFRVIRAEAAKAAGGGGRNA